MTLLATLENGIDELQIIVTTQQKELLVKYVDLLAKWNKVFSLTAIRNKPDMIKYHVLDCLVAIKYFANLHNILDVGSGMGVPAVILSIMLPQQNIVAIDSNQKKIAFLTQCKIELNLINLTLVNQRVEEYSYSDKFDIITSRAFADLALFIKLTKHLLKDNGAFLAFKGDKGVAEVDLLLNWQAEIFKLNVPFIDSERFLIKMEKYV